MTMRKIQHRFRKSSFTLVELIVAMAIFSIMMMMVIGFFTDTQKLWSRTDDKNNMYADARIAMDLMSSALQSVYYQAAGDTYNQEIFWFGATADNNTSGRLIFPVNLSRNSPFYPSSHTSATEFQKAFYMSFWLENKLDNGVIADQVLKVANDNGNTNFINAAACPASTVFTNNTETIVGHITELRFRLFGSGFNILNSGAYSSRVFPHAVQITLKMMPKNAFDTWIAQRGAGTENAAQLQFRQENEYEFVRIIYLGVF